MKFMLCLNIEKGICYEQLNTLIEEFKSKVDFINLHVDIDNEIGQRFWIC